MGDVQLAADFDVAAQLERKCDTELIETLVLSMPEPDRTIFIKQHYLMMTIKEIADEVALNEKQIRNRLYQSRLKLRNQMKNKGVKL